MNFMGGTCQEYSFSFLPVVSRYLVVLLMSPYRIINRSKTWKPPSELAINYAHTSISKGFLEILSSTYGLGPYGPGPLLIWKSFPSQMCSRTIFEMHTVREACLLYSPGQCAFQIWSWSIFDLEYSLRLFMVQVLDHKSRPKSQKSFQKGYITVK